MNFPVFSETDAHLEIIPCVVFFAPPGDSEQSSEAMLAIAHRSGRLPVALMPAATAGSPTALNESSEPISSQSSQPPQLPQLPQLPQPLAWSCADGVIEQVAIGSEHPDLLALWMQIKGLGLLVSEFLITGGENGTGGENDTGGEHGNRQKRQKTHDDQTGLLEMTPAGYWILNQKGSKGWFSESLRNDN